MDAHESVCICEQKTYSPNACVCEVCVSDKRHCKRHQANNLLEIIWDVDERSKDTTTFLNENLSATVQDVLHFLLLSAFLNANFKFTSSFSDNDAC